MEKHIVQFFKFLEDKGEQKIPFTYKLSDPQTWGKFTEKDLKVNGYLNLSRTDIKELPQGLEVSGFLNLSLCESLTELPQGLKVGEFLNLYGCTSLEKLPEGLKVGKYLWLKGCTSLKELPKGLKVGGNLFLSNTPISKKYSKEQIRSMIEDDGGYVKGEIIT